jgi:hypothetical protein
MRRVVFVVGVFVVGVLAVCAGGAVAQPTGDDLSGWALTHWNAMGTGSAEAVAAGFAPDAGVAFFGTAWDGFYYGPDVKTAWEQFFTGFPVQGHALSGVVRAVAEASLVYGALELTVPGGTVVVESFLQFTADGKIRAADYVLVTTPDKVVPIVDGQIADGEYLHSAQDMRSRVTLSWRNGLVVLFVALRSPGTGWVAAGFDPVRRMLGANFIMAAVTTEGLVIEDHFGIGVTSHRRDSREDILRAAGTVAGGQTIVEFVIPLDSGDAEDKPLVPGRTYTVLLAYHRSATSFTVIHTARGSVQMELED